jgi:hypothetical protein
MMKTKTLALCLVCALALLAQSCNLPLRSTPPISTHDPLDVALSAAQTAHALADPGQAQDGVWSLLANLGIGVYTGSGEQVMPGSEQGEASFWLYDFELPALAKMAQEEPEPFDRYAARLEALGYEGSPQELLDLYKSVYARHPDHPLIQILTSMGVDFSPGTTLTPLQEWLLLLDTFMPPNRSNASLLYGRTHLASMVQPGHALQTACGAIQGGNIIPYWGLMQQESGMAALLQAREVYYAIHGPMIAQAASYELTASGRSAHEGHEGKGDKLEYVVRVHVDYQPWQSIPVAGISCGALINLDFHVLQGGLANVLVDWVIPDVFYAHGMVEDQEPSTNGAGEARLSFQAQEEAARGIGTFKESTGEVSAWLNLRPGFLAAGITDPRLLQFVPEQVPVDRQWVEVSWHELCDHFTLIFSEELHQQVPQMTNNIFIEGPVDVTIDLSHDPPTLEGEGSLTVSGSGQIGGCPAQDSGSDEVTISGTVSAGEGQDPPMLHLSIVHTMQLQIQACGGGGGMPMPITLEPGETDLPFRDGEVRSWTMTQPSVTSITSYTLEVPCGE